MGTATAPEPAARHELCRTTDYDEAIDIITKVYVPHKLVLPQRALDLSLAWTPLRHIVLGHLSYGAESHLIAPKLETFYHVNLTIRGRTRSTRGPDEVFTDLSTGLVFLPSQPASVHWSDDCLQLAMKIDKWGLEHELEKLLARPVKETIHFDLGLDVRRPAVGSFVRALHFLRDELQVDGGVAGHPLGLPQLESVVMTSLLLAQPSNYSEALHADTRHAHPRAVSTVVQLMEAEPDVHRSLGDYAAAAGVSARALQDGSAAISARPRRPTCATCGCSGSGRTCWPRTPRRRPSPRSWAGGAFCSSGVRPPPTARGSASSPPRRSGADRAPPARPGGGSPGRPSR